MGVNKKLIDIFADHHVMGEEVSVDEGSVTHRRILIPSWWSARFTEFVIELERRVQISILSKKSKGPKRTLRTFIVPENSTIETYNVPKGLPRDCYCEIKFLSCLLPVQLKSWSLQPPIFLDNVNTLFSPTGNNQQASPATSRFSVSQPTSQYAVPIASTSKSTNMQQDQSEFPEGMFDDVMADESGENSL